MPIYLRYHLSTIDALFEGTTQAGLDYYELTHDDVARFRDDEEGRFRDGLAAVAGPYLYDSKQLSGKERDGERALAVTHAEFPAAMFETLESRRHRLARVRQLQELAATPSWECALELAGWAEDEIELRLPHAPEDVVVPEISHDTTIALVLSRWARDLVRVVRAESGRDIPDVPSLNHLLYGGGMPPSVTRLILAGGQADPAWAWIPEDIYRKVTKYSDLCDAEEVQVVQVGAELPGLTAGRYCHEIGCVEAIILTLTKRTFSAHVPEPGPQMLALDQAAVFLGWRVYQEVWWCPAHTTAKLLACANCLSPCPECSCEGAPGITAVAGMLEPTGGLGDIHS